MLISNRTILFSHFSQKYPNQAFLVRNLGILVFSSNFANRQNWGALISNMTRVFFKFSPKNTQITHFWVQIYACLFFCQIFLVDKFEGVDFKYDNAVFKFQLQNICVLSGVSGPKFRHFGFSSNFANRQIWGCLFQIWQDCFQILV